MLNENYRKFVGGLLTGVGSINNLTPYLQVGNDSDVSFDVSTWANMSSVDIIMSRGLSVILGSGDTEPTLQDVQLDSIINNATPITFSMNEGTSDYVKIVSVTYKNNTTEKIIVKEIGLMVQNWAYGGTCYKRALLGRVVLDAPVVMNSGDAYTFTYAIE